MNLPDKNKLLHNFSSCRNWEEKYLYIIELGDHLPPLPASMRTREHLIVGCQSQVWVAVSSDNNDGVLLHGHSDAAIVKGLIAIVFSLYQNLTLSEIITYDVRPFFSMLALNEHLTTSRSQGLEAIVQGIRAQIIAQL